MEHCKQDHDQVFREVRERTTTRKRTFALPAANVGLPPKPHLRRHCDERPLMECADCFTGDVSLQGCKLGQASGSARSCRHDPDGDRIAQQCLKLTCSGRILSVFLSVGKTAATLCKNWRIPATEVRGIRYARKIPVVFAVRRELCRDEFALDWHLRHTLREPAPIVQHRLSVGLLPDYHQTENRHADDFRLHGLDRKAGDSHGFSLAQFAGTKVKVT
jgi:hypothetical protein